MALSSLGNGLDELGTTNRKNPFSRLNTRFNAGSRNVGNVERWASVLGGAALAALALRRRSKGAMGLAALAGAPLLWRGATGHCAVYQKLGIDRGGQTGLSENTQLATLDTLDPHRFDFDEGRNKPLDGTTEARPVTTTDRQPIGQNI
ncbi:MAG TPA: YgaP-like transmembrane domain [Thermoanaerobaculia bacterium]|nr:YgaP-like transmembrane domain [Thermoanaerobaculia bacterium]